MVLSYVRIDVILYKVTKYLSNYKILDYNIFFINISHLFLHLFCGISLQMVCQRLCLVSLILVRLLVWFRLCKEFPPESRHASIFHENLLCYSHKHLFAAINSYRNRVDALFFCRQFLSVSSVPFWQLPLLRTLP